MISVPADCMPDVALPVDPEFAGLYCDVTCDGAIVAARSSICVVGLARQIAHVLPTSIERIAQTAHLFRDWRAVVVENDSKDGTKDILEQWANAHPSHVYVECSDNGRPHLRGFERDRVMALAEYRNRCRQLVAEHASHCDYVMVVDLDSWGGWSTHGVLNGVGWHERLSAAGCLASTSLFKHHGSKIDGRSPWCHYDAWAYRWIGWAPRMGPWFTFWLPPPGAPPIQVHSAFGGLALYKTNPYLGSEYSAEDGDCEHVHFHRTMERDGWEVFLNPSQRCVMQWLVEEAADGRRDGHDQR